MQDERSPRQRPEVIASEFRVATEIQYSIKPLGDTSLRAVHYRVRRLFLWGRWVPMREPTFYSYDAACRYLASILPEKNVRLYDPLVRESIPSEDSGPK